MAANRRVKDFLAKFGTLIVELYDVKAPAQFISPEGRVGVMIGLKSQDVPAKLQLSLSEISIVNIKLMTLQELDYSNKNGEGGRIKLQELFEKSSGTITNTTRPSVV